MHLSVHELVAALRGEPSVARDSHLVACDVCRQRRDAASAQAMTEEALTDAVARADALSSGSPLERAPPLPELLTRGFGRRVGHILRISPLIELHQKDAQARFGHFGRLEVAVLALHAVLDRMEAGDGGALRDVLVRDLIAALTWAEQTAGFLPGRSADKRQYVEELLDDLTNAKLQGKPFESSFRAYHQSAALLTERFRLLTYREVDGQLRYVVSDDGLDVLYRLHEVDQFLAVEVELLLLLRQVERGQFERALSSLERLGTACAMQRKRMEELAARIRRDPSSVSNQEIEANHGEVSRQHAEEKKLYDRLKKAIGAKDREVSDLFAVSSLAERKKRGEQLTRIRRGLDRNFQAHQGLVSDNLSLRQRHLSALARSAALRGRYRSLKIEPDVFEPFLGVPPRGARDAWLAARLLPPRKPRVFSPWQLPFGIRAEAEGSFPTDFFPEDVPPGDDPIGEELLRLAPIHAALLHALVRLGGEAALSSLIRDDALAELIDVDARLVAIHLLFVHNVRDHDLLDPAGPFALLMRASRDRLPVLPEPRLRAVGRDGRCTVGSFILTDMTLSFVSADAPRS